MCPFFFKKQKLNKVKIASDRTETNRNNMYFTRKHMGMVHKNARKQIEKKRKTAELKNLLIFLKTINFKVMKTIRYQMKTSDRFIITRAFMRGHSELSFFKFLCGNKRNSK